MPSARLVGMSRDLKRILVVAGLDALRSLMVRVLIAEGYQVVGVATASEATALSGSERFNLLVTGHAVPGGRGPELARGAVEANPELSVLFISGSPETTLDLEVPGARTRFLQTPFDLDALVAVVRDLLGPGP